MGNGAQRLSPQEFQQLKRKYDKNNDGRLSFQEVKLIAEEIRRIEGVPQPLPDKFVQSLFRALDKDGNGFIGFDEFEGAYELLQQQRAKGAGAKGKSKAKAVAGNASKGKGAGPAAAAVAGKGKGAAPAAAAAAKPTAASVGKGPAAAKGKAAGKGGSPAPALPAGATAGQGASSLTELKRKAVQKGMLLTDANAKTESELQEWLLDQEIREAAAMKIQAVQRGKQEREKMSKLKAGQKGSPMPQVPLKGKGKLEQPGIKGAGKGVGKVAPGARPPPGAKLPPGAKPPPGAKLPPGAPRPAAKAPPQNAAALNDLKRRAVQKGLLLRDANTMTAPQLQRWLQDKEQKEQAAIKIQAIQRGRQERLRLQQQGKAVGRMAMGLAFAKGKPKGPPPQHPPAKAPGRQGQAAARPAAASAAAAPPPRRRQRSTVVEEPLRHKSLHATLWRYNPDAEEPLCLRSTPEAGAPMMEYKLDPGDIFVVSQELRGGDRVLHLKLADGRGWVPDRPVDANGPMRRHCFRHKVDEGYVTVSMIIQNVSFSMLSWEDSLLASFRAALREAIAEASGDCEVEPEHVGLALWSGSVIVQAVVAPPDKSPETVLAAIRSAKLDALVLKKVALLEGIHSATTGTIGVGCISVSSTAVAPPACQQQGPQAQEDGEGAERPPPEPPPPEVPIEPPLPKYRPWAPTLRAAAADSSRSFLDASEAARRGGRRPALLEDDAEVGAEELSYMQVAEVGGPRPDDPSELSDAESQESVDSISGEVSRPWGAAVRESRYQYAGRDRALGFSESWRPLSWSEKDWESRLRKAGALKVPPPSAAPLPPPKAVPLAQAESAFDRLGGGFGNAMMLRAAAKGFRHGGRELAAREARETRAQVVDRMRETLASVPACTPVELPDFQVSEISELVQLYGSIAGERGHGEDVGGPGDGGAAASQPTGNHKPNVLHMLDRSWARSASSSSSLPSNSLGSSYGALMNTAASSSMPLPLPLPTGLPLPSSASALQPTGEQAAAQGGSRKVWL